MRYKDPDERDYDEEEEKFDNDKPEISREFVKARLHSRTLVISIPNDLREPVGILPGSKLLLTVIDNQVDLQKILSDGKFGILVTKE